MGAWPVSRAVHDLVLSLPQKYPHKPTHPGLWGPSIGLLAFPGHMETRRLRKLSRAASAMVRTAAPNMIESFMTSRPTPDR